VPGRAVPGGHR